MERKKRVKTPNRPRKLQLPHLFLFCMYSPPQSKCFPLLFLLSTFPSLPAFSSSHGLHFTWEGRWAVVLIPVASSKQLHREILEQDALPVVAQFWRWTMASGWLGAGHLLCAGPSQCQRAQGFTVNERDEGWVAVHWQTMQN